METFTKIKNGSETPSSLPSGEAERKGIPPTCASRFRQCQITRIANMLQIVRNPRLYKNLVFHYICAQTNNLNAIN
ncbi:hypothetical protein SAMN05660816_04450 [Niastella yeongjuensis]|nr:hypothetical protein SAMN05660816_04450 [Niastella yeongjuensis]